MPLIAQGRLVCLRPLSQQDLAPLHRWLNDPDVMQYWDGRDHPATFDRVEARFRRSIEGSDREVSRFMIDLVTEGDEGDGRTIGMIQHGRIHPRVKVAQVDILIGEADFRDGGYGTDAVTAFLGYLFDTLHVHRVWVSMRDGNTRAMRASEKCGFQREGVLRDHDWLEGKYVDVVLYGMLASEWQTRPRDSRPSDGKRS